MVFGGWVRQFSPLGLGSEILRQAQDRPWGSRQRTRPALLRMNGLVEGLGLPPFRQEKGERTGHGAFGLGRVFIADVTCNASHDAQDDSLYVDEGGKPIASAR